MNACLAFNIFTFELRKNSKFNKWFEDNSKLAAIITLFSSGDIGLLHLLDSNFAGLELFSAPFSSKASYRIFWGGVLNIFIEDLPQLLIQVKFSFKWFLFFIMDQNSFLFMPGSRSCTL